MGQVDSKDSPPPSAAGSSGPPPTKPQLERGHADLEAQEQRERERVAKLIDGMETTQLKLRSEMPCEDTQQAALECYKQHKNDGQLLDCSKFVDAYLHCTSTQ